MLALSRKSIAGVFIVVIVDPAGEGPQILTCIRALGPHIC